MPARVCTSVAYRSLSQVSPFQRRRKNLLDALGQFLVRDPKAQAIRFEGESARENHLLQYLLGVDPFVNVGYRLAARERHLAGAAHL